MHGCVSLSKRFTAGIWFNSVVTDESEVKKMLKASIMYETKLIDFWHQHWYRIMGELGQEIAILPSVTSILDLTLNKGEQFNQYLKNNGLQADVIMKRAGENGTKIHAAVEKMINGGMVSAVEDEFEEPEWKKLCNFVNWYKGLDITPIITEKTVYDLDLGYAGTVDFVCKIGSDNWLIDWKSGNNVYNSGHFQVAAYVKAWNKLQRGAPKPIKIKRAGIVHIGGCTKTKKDFNNIGVKMYEVDINKSFIAFKKILTLYNTVFPNRTAPTSIYPLELSLNGGVEDEACYE